MRCYEHWNILSKDKSFKEKKKMKKKKRKKKIEREGKMDNFLRKIIESDDIK